MSDRPSNYPSDKFRFIDGLVLVLFISTAIYGLYLFRQDLMRTFDMRDAEPAGTITFRANTVQRRHEDRVLWDRLFVESYVYPGDLIRVADYSSANVDIASNEIYLNENTLIRIQRGMDGMGSFQVELREGNLSITSGAESEGIMLNLFGNQVQTTSGSVLNASADEDGIAVQVNEGTVAFIQEGQKREMIGGSLVAFDAAGVERINPAVVVKRPWQNARYLKSTNENLVINFEWTRSNIDPGETLRLEFASDIDFRSIIGVLDITDNTTQAAFDVGQWYWRISYENTVLRRGWFNVYDSSGPVLISPVTDTVFRHQEGSSLQVRFQWSEKAEASRYLVEISDNQNFTDLITRQVSATSLMLSQLGSGTWYWRVKPSFPKAYDGETGYSQTGSFRIEQTKDAVDSARAIEIPAAAVERARTANAQAIRGSSFTPQTSASQGSAAPQGSTAQFAVRPGSFQIMGRSRQYTIRPGDTLGRVAREFYGDPMLWSRISEANNIRNPDLIYPGQTFIIP